MKKQIIFVDPGNISEFNGELYLEERSCIGFSAYKKYLDEHDSSINIKLVSVGGVENKSAGQISNLIQLPPELKSIARPEKLSDYIKTVDWNDSMVYSLLNAKTLILSEQNIPTVYLVENPLKVRLDGVFANTSLKSLNGMRMALGQIRYELKFRKALKAALGVQINGGAAYKAYVSCNPESMKFYDHRVNDLPDLGEKDSRQRLDIAFSGRFIPIKGSAYMADISQELKKKLPDSLFYFLGDGELKPGIIKESADNVVDKGFMRYEDEWEPFVRSKVDVMVLPHTQGDPSMTYFESLGQGVPVLGFENETLSSLAELGLGWTVPQGDTAALVQKLVELKEEPQKLQEARQTALDFMRENLYDRTVERRMEHLLKVAHQS